MDLPVTRYYGSKRKLVDAIWNALEYESNFWLVAATIEPEVRVKGQENAYKEVIKSAVGGAAGVIKAVDSAVTDCQPNDNVEALFKVGFCLPAGPFVTDEDVKYIVESIKEAIS